MTEQWKDVEGFEHLYQVSNIGRVRSLPRTTTSGRILKPAVDKDGYLRVRLVDGKVSKNFYVHRLVALAFIPNPCGFPVINHKDEDKQNNRVDNLEFCTIKYNNTYNDGAKRRGLPRRKPIDQYDMNGNLVAHWSGRAEIAKTLGFHGGNISEVCQGKRNHASGFVWRYADA